jgi:hypothetical protein
MLRRFVVDSFGDYAEAKLVAHFRENFQAFLAHPLKTIG